MEGARERVEDPREAVEGARDGAWDAVSDLAEGALEVTEDEREGAALNGMGSAATDGVGSISSDAISAGYFRENTERAADGVRFSSEIRVETDELEDMDGVRCGGGLRLEADDVVEAFEDVDEARETLSEIITGTGRIR